MISKMYFPSYFVIVKAHTISHTSAKDVNYLYSSIDAGKQKYCKITILQDVSVENKLHNLDGRREGRRILHDKNV